MLFTLDGVEKDSIHNKANRVQPSIGCKLAFGGWLFRAACLSISMNAFAKSLYQAIHRIYDTISTSSPRSGMKPEMPDRRRACVMEKPSASPSLHFTLVSPNAASSLLK